jgi:hypothetical protein
MEWNLLNGLFGLGTKTTVTAKEVALSQQEPTTPASPQQDEDADVKKIREFAGGELRTGMVIEITLHEILELIPPANPNRRRKDSYDRLTRKLRELGVELRIDSSRNRP